MNESLLKEEQVESEDKKTKYEIQKLFVKKQTCELMLGSEVFKTGQTPEVNLEMNVKFEQVKKDHYEVTLRLYIIGKVEVHTAYLVEVQQAGLFKIEGFNSEQMELLLNVHCPNLLYPYARKEITSLTAAAGLVPLVLMPINFEALYQQKQKTAKEQQQKEEHEQISQAALVN